ncbi:hypothetical protein CPB84DRAFT_1749120 [Gymnopilus junonius]|uniref:Uncharacterized protein n=1 Tax=Gymnopilus junonius TaxID=109634 RepID=A0A9P5NL66_GYMJU|nr:hypothetical protein CPB84DRAFT_1749120 [Gymnopilus junonius]
MIASETITLCIPLGRAEFANEVWTTTTVLLPEVVNDGKPSAALRVVAGVGTLATAGVDWEEVVWAGVDVVEVDVACVWVVVPVVWICWVVDLWEVWEVFWAAEDEEVWLVEGVDDAVDVEEVEEDSGAAKYAAAQELEKTYSLHPVALAAVDAQVEAQEAEANRGDETVLEDSGRFWQHNQTAKDKNG